MKTKITDKGIFIPLKIGDVISTGRFKNKKIKVKSVDLDDRGLPVINGKKALTFRLIMKELGHK